VTKTEKRVVASAMRWYRSHLNAPYGYRVDVELWNACKKNEARAKSKRRKG
jgi:hypothetical protein